MIFKYLLTKGYSLVECHRAPNGFQVVGTAT